MAQYKSNLDYKEWLSELTDKYFKIIQSISIYPYAIINLIMILTSILTGLDLFRSNNEFYFTLIACITLGFTTIANHFARSLKVYALLALFEFSSLANIVTYYAATNESRIFIITASLITFSMEFFLFEINSWVILALQVKNLILMLHYENLLNLSFDKLAGQTSSFVFITVVITLSVWAGIRDKVLKEIYRYKLQIHKKQLNLQTVLEHIPDGIIVLNLQYYPKLLNNSLKRIMNIQHKNQFYPIFKTLFYSPGRRIYPYNFQNLLVKDVKNFIHNEHSDSITFGVTEIDSRFYEWKGSFSPWNGSKSLILVVRDITSLIELEKSNAIQVYQRAILRALSHELRTPLSIIISTSESMKTNLNHVDGSILDKLNIIHINSILLLNIINNLLDFVQFTNNVFKLNQSLFNFRNLMQDTINLFTSQAAQKNINLSLYIASFIPVEILNDSGRIQQILINVLSNSLKFTQTGSILVKAKLAGTKIKLLIQDTGIGINPDILTKIFDPVRSINHKGKLLHGSGMKLHISNLIAKSLGNCEMRAKSIQEVGTTLTFYIDINVNSYRSYENLETLTEHEDPIYLPLSHVTRNSSKDQARILIVDDNEFNRLIIGEFLKQENLEYDEAINGDLAVQAVKLKNREKDNYRVVIMDCQMPVMDGFEATAHINELARIGAIQFCPAIVGYSAYCGSEEENRSKQVGMCEFLLKPTPKHVFMYTIKKYLIIYNS